MKYLDKMKRKKLGELLIDEGLVTSDQVVEALKEQKRSGEPIGEILIGFGAVSEWDIAQTLAKQFQLPFIHASRCMILPELGELIPAEVLHRYQCVPLDRFGDLLTMAVAGLLNEKMIAELEERSGCQLLLYVALPTEIKRVLNEQFPFGGKVRKSDPSVDAPPAGTAADEWERLFDLGNESVLSEIKPEDEAADGNRSSRSDPGS